MSWRVDELESWRVDGASWGVWQLGVERASR